MSKDPTRAEALGESEQAPASDQTDNPSSIGDLRLAGDGRTNLAVDSARSKVNDTRALPFFEQLQNLVGATDKAVVSVVQNEEDELDLFIEQYQIENGVEPPFSVWRAAKEQIQAQRTSFDGSSVSNGRYRDVAYVDRLSKSPAEIPEEVVELPGNKLVRYAEPTETEPSEESDAPVYLIDALIWIQGVEVSEYLIGQVRVSLSGTSGHNTATFTLENSDDRFVWTERNLYPIHGSSATRAGAPYLRALEKTLDQISTIQNDGLFEEDAVERARLLRQLQFTQHEVVKEQIYAYKADPTRNPPIRNPKNGISHARFDLVPNKCCFQRMDPVRIFSLYPFRVPGKQYETVSTASITGDIDDEGTFATSGRRELWMPEFTGYIQHVTIDDENTSGASRVTVNCADFRQSVLRRMRISNDLTSGLSSPLGALGFRVSPTSQFTGQSGQTAQDIAFQREFKDNTDGFYDIDETQFYDDIIVTPFNHVVPNKPLEEAMRDLLVPKGKITAEKNNRGVRGVEYGGAFYYDSRGFTRDQAREFLESWHKMCLFGPKRRPWTRDEVEAVGAGTTSDGPYAPNKIRLWFLLPSEGTGPRNLADLGQISVSLSHDSNWTNRQEVLTNLADSIDYNYMITPTGDIIVEFLQADFRPEDYGEFKQSFRFDKHLLSTMIADEQESPPAGLIVTTNFTVGHASTGSSIADTALTRTFVYSPYIAARYGIEIENDSIPFLLASDKRVAQQRAVMLYQRRLARCNAMTASASYRPFLLPNRPVHHLRRSRIGSIVSIDKILSPTAQPKGELAIGLEHIRQFSGHYRTPEDFRGLNELQTRELRIGGVDPANPKDNLESVESFDPLELQVFTTVAAGESTPLSARVGWSSQGILAPNSGIYVLDLDRRPVDIETPEVSDVPVDEPELESQGDLSPPAEATPEPVTETVDSTYKFPFNPLDTMVVTSNFGSRTDPVNGQKNSFHKGMDLRAAIGTAAYAVDAGVIIKAGRQSAAGTPVSGRLDAPGTGGNITLLKTDSGFLVQYLHLADSTRGIVSFGQRVVAGQKIAITGNTGGRGKNPHLHIEVIAQQAAVTQGKAKTTGPLDPRLYFKGPLAGKGEGE